MPKGVRDDDGHSPLPSLQTQAKEDSTGISALSSQEPQATLFCMGAGSGVGEAISVDGKQFIAKGRARWRLGRVGGLVISEHAYPPDNSLPFLAWTQTEYLKLILFQKI